MSHLALYRQYRPKTFGEVAGQDHIRMILRNAVKLDRVSHAYLFTGPRGTGKTSLARILSRAINCLTPADGEPCNACEMCMSALNESLTDIIEMDAASHTGVDDMRDMIEKAAFAPSRAKKKIYIIDEVHMLSKSAFNALLKTLEEPPDHAHFILATTEAHKVLPTIISRCQRFDFHRITPQDIVAILTDVAQHEKITVEVDALTVIAKQANGGLRDALSIFEQVAVSKQVTLATVVETLGLSSVQSVQDFLIAIDAKDSHKAITLISELRSEGKDINQFSQEVLQSLRERMIAAASANDTAALSTTLRLIDIFFKAYFQQRDAVIAELPLEMAVIAACASPVVHVPATTPPSEAPSAAIGSRVHRPIASTQDVQKNLLAKITHPTVKAILKSARIMKEDEGLLIAVDSDFVRAKLMAAEHAGDIDHAIKEMYGDISWNVRVISQSEQVSHSDIEEIFS